MTLEKNKNNLFGQAIPADTFTGIFGINGWSYMLSVKVLIMVYLNSAANPIVYYTRWVQHSQPEIYFVPET